MGAKTEPRPATGSWFDEAVRDHYSLVYAISYQQLGRVQDAEDAAQDTFLRAYRGRNGLREREKLAGWLARIAYRTAADVGRKKGRQSGRVPLSPGLAAPPVRPRWTPEHEAIQQAIARLSDSEALVVNLRFMEGLKSTEIAEQLNEKPVTVRVRLHRALKRLKGFLGKDSDHGH